VSLAGLDMGVYKPTLQRLQEIHESASELAGDILTTENPLNDIRSTEEFRANELALNVTWALMNDPSIPKKSEPEIPDREDVVRVEEIAAVPVPSIVKPALIPRAVNMTRAIRLNVSSDMANLRNFDALPAGSEAEATILSATRYVSAAVSQVDAVADGSLTVPAPVVEVASVPEVVELSPVQVSATEPNVAVMAAAPQVPLNDMDETVSISRYTTSTMQNEGEEVYEKQSPAEVADVSEAARIRFIGNSGDFVRVRGVVPTLAKSANFMPPSTAGRVTGPAGPIHIATDVQHQGVSSEMPSEVASMSVSPSCVGRNSCSDCVLDSACVWCPTMNTCVPGASNGPTASFACAAGGFLYGTCDSGSNPWSVETARPEVPQVIPGNCEDLEAEN